MEVEGESFSTINNNNNKNISKSTSVLKNTLATSTSSIPAIPSKLCSSVVNNKRGDCVVGPLCVIPSSGISDGN